MNLFSVLLALVAIGQESSGRAPCPVSDPELVHCPLVEAPRITELRGGNVTLELDVAPNGKVRSSRVVSSSGHPAWRNAAQAAVATWRYSASPASRTRKVPLTFQVRDP